MNVAQLLHVQSMSSQNSNLQLSFLFIIYQIELLQLLELLWLCCTHEDENLCIVESFVNTAEEVWKSRLSNVAMKCAVLIKKLSGGFLIENYTYTITIYSFSNSDGHLWLYDCSKLKHSMRPCAVFHTIRWIKSSSSYFPWSSASPPPPSPHRAPTQQSKSRQSCCQPC